MFRFSIRDLLWLTVVVAMGLGWWLDRSNLEQIGDEQYEIYRDNLRTVAKHGTAEYDFVVGADGRWTAIPQR